MMFGVCPSKWRISILLPNWYFPPAGLSLFVWHRTLYFSAFSQNRSIIIVATVKITKKICVLPPWRLSHDCRFCEMQMFINWHRTASYFLIQVFMAEDKKYKNTKKLKWIKIKICINCSVFFLINLRGSGSFLLWDYGRFFGINVYNILWDHILEGIFRRFT